MLYSGMTNTFEQILNFIDDARAKEADRDFWKGILNTLPIPIVIIDSERKIIFQNLINSTLFDTNVTNQEVCPACKSYGKMGSCEDCPINIALCDCVVAEKTLIIERRCYREVATPTATNNGTVVVVMFLPSKECHF